MSVCAHVTQYQAPFLDHPQVWLEKPIAISPDTTLLPDDNPQVLIHDYHMTTDETRNVGAAIVTLTKRFGPKPGTSAQKAELIDLTQALR